VKYVIVAIAIAGCGERKQDGITFDPTAGSAAAEAVVAGSATASIGASAEDRLPANCDRYRNVVALLTECETVPRPTREGLLSSFEQLSSLWQHMAPEAMAALDSTCETAADALVATVRNACPELADRFPLTIGKDPRPVIGSRDVPAERGVPFDQTVLGPLPHPFGALDPLRPGITRDEILSLLPSARRDDGEVRVPIGVDQLEARIVFDYTDRLDWVILQIPKDKRELIYRSWGKPHQSATEDTWFDRKRGWRADLDRKNELTIGFFLPFANLIGRGPDGLAETKPILGATLAELRERFGARFKEEDVLDSDDNPTGKKTYQLLLPATDVCMYFTDLDLELTDARVTRARLRQCFSDDTRRRAALTAMEQRWGRAVPARDTDDHPVFRFHLPRRRIEARPTDLPDRGSFWQLDITAR
jgi:hypothetical protein